MQNQNIQKNQVIRSVEKLFEEFERIIPFSKAVLKYGSQLFLALFALGTFLLVYSRTVLNYDPYMELISGTIIKSSFSIFAESVFCSLFMDYFIKR